MTKFFTGWLVVSGLALATTAAQAQTQAPTPGGGARPPYNTVSDVGGPYYAPPPQYPGPRNGPAYGPAYGQGPMLLPPTEVYTVVRESGFSPLGPPRQRGFAYVIAVVGRAGESGRLIIDARDGRVRRFVPSHRMGVPFGDELTLNGGPPGPPPPPHALPPPQAMPPHAMGEPLPPRPAPHVASRSVPVPKPSPLAAARPTATEPVAKPIAAEPAAKPVAAEPAAKPATAANPVQQSASAQPKAVEAQSPPAAAATIAAPAKPAAQVAPTQDMPKVQGLE